MKVVEENQRFVVLAEVCEGCGTQFDPSWFGPDTRPSICPQCASDVVLSSATPMSPGSLDRTVTGIIPRSAPVSQ